jgi:hypothetical protein
VPTTFGLIAGAYLDPSRPAPGYQQQVGDQQIIRKRFFDRFLKKAGLAERAQWTLIAT